MADDFKQVIEQVKLRNPIEDVVRERVPGLRRAGSLWSACCPFHEEKTPSFKVDPRKGTWRCYGACNDGGDQIQFVERAYNVEFREALEILAARVGLSLPQRRGERAREENEELYAVLTRAEEFYRRWLRRPEGAAALNYVRNRGLTDATIDAFGVGFAPIGSRELVVRAMAQGVAQERLIELGLARADATGGGRAYDFFQGRLMIPVRDLRGRTVGFGARRLSDDDKRAPKYINTPQTPLFHKGRLIYALDRALEHVRASGHLILVEGYTDVMAAHQVGLRTVVAVLGTATTEDHAALVRRTGARRVSLLFDGDDAGRRATWRALEGLLALDVTIDVVRLIGDKDPCDLLVREGVAPLEQLLSRATDWFQFLIEGLQSLEGNERWRELDRVLALLSRIPRPAVRDELVAQLARALDLPVDGVRKQFETLPERRREELRRREQAEGERTDAPQPVAARAPDADPRVLLAFRCLTALAAREPSFAHEALDVIDDCPQASWRRVIEAACICAREHGASATFEHVLAALGDDPARRELVPLLDELTGAEDPRAFLDDNLRAVRDAIERRYYAAQAASLASDADTTASILRELHPHLRSRLS